tara:strand:- start:1138 stop:1470 length:333 start_codon:yes stop_codon:yes gene_type:complete
MKIQYRTFVNKDCDREVFGPLFDHAHYHITFGDFEAAFFTDTLREVSGDLSMVYDNINLSQYGDWTGEELYNSVLNEISVNNYMGAVEATQAQAGLIFEYYQSITPQDEV